MLHDEHLSRRSSLAGLPPRAVIGHRGNSAFAPENTLESFRQALALGAHGLEFDVRLTSDGEVIVLHDANLRRTTGVDTLARSLRWDALRSLDAGRRFTRDSGVTFPWKERGVTIPRLRDVLEAWPDVPMLIEIKESDAAAAVERVILDLGAQRHVTVAAFSHTTLSHFEKSPIPRTPSVREVASVVMPALAGKRFASLPWQAMSLPRFYRGIPVPLGAIAQAVSSAGVSVSAWVINDVARAHKLWNAGLAAVLSDDPGLVLAGR